MSVKHLTYFSFKDVTKTRTRLHSSSFLRRLMEKRPPPPTTKFTDSRVVFFLLRAGVLTSDRGLFFYFSVLNDVNSLLPRVLLQGLSPALIQKNSSRGFCLEQLFYQERRQFQEALVFSLLFGSLSGFLRLVRLA